MLEFQNNKQKLNSSHFSLNIILLPLKAPLNCSFPIICTQHKQPKLTSLLAVLLLVTGIIIVPANLHLHQASTRRLLSHILRLLQVHVPVRVRLSLSPARAGCLSRRVTALPSHAAVSGVALLVLTVRGLFAVGQLRLGLFAVVLGQVASTVGH